MKNANDLYRQARQAAMAAPGFDDLTITKLFLIGNGFKGKAHYQRRYHIALNGRETYCGRPCVPPLESDLIQVRRINRSEGGTMLLAGPDRVVVCLECQKAYDAANVGEAATR